MDERKPKCGECADEKCTGLWRSKKDPSFDPTLDACEDFVRWVPADPSPEVVERGAEAACNTYQDEIGVAAMRWNIINDKMRGHWRNVVLAAIRAMGGKP